MNRQAKIIIGALAGVVFALGVALTVTFATGDDLVMPGMSGMSGMSSGDDSMRMMMAMGNMDSAAMLEHMRQVLGEDGYQRMLDHMREQASSMPSMPGMPAAGSQSMDAVMHRMMADMVPQMPAAGGGSTPR